MQSLLASLLAAGVLISACAPPPSTPSAKTTPASNEFVNKVWRVSDSSAVARGTLYVFLADGTLVITSEHSKPALGAWTYEGGRLTMVEESIAYPTEILGLSADQFRIRSRNPGGAVEITLVPAMP